MSFNIDCFVKGMKTQYHHLKGRTCTQFRGPLEVKIEVERPGMVKIYYKLIDILKENTFRTTKSTRRLPRALNFIQL